MILLIEQKVFGK